MLNPHLQMGFNNWQPEGPGCVPRGGCSRRISSMRTIDTAVPVLPAHAADATVSPGCIRCPLCSSIVPLRKATEHFVSMECQLGRPGPRDRAADRDKNAPASINSAEGSEARGYELSVQGPNSDVWLAGFTKTRDWLKSTEGLVPRPESGRFGGASVM